METFEETFYKSTIKNLNYWLFKLAINVYRDKKLKIIFMLYMLYVSSQLTRLRWGRGRVG